MITIPTGELVGGLADAIPHITDPKGATAGVKIEWDGERLSFTAFDTLSGVTVRYVPGEGEERHLDESDPHADIAWGGTDDPWSVFLWLDQAKEVVKLFKLPAKLWAVPVTLKCNVSRDRLIIAREDGPRVGRELILPSDSDMADKISDTERLLNATFVARSKDADTVTAASFSHTRLGAFGASRWHGDMVLTFGRDGSPVEVTMGTRLVGFIYPAGERPGRTSLLRLGSGVHVRGGAE